jgi:hypothetical protein
MAAARAAGVQIAIDGADLVLEASGPCCVAEWLNRKPGALAAGPLPSLR